jgi:multidrug efflux system membrane fusion protein
MKTRSLFLLILLLFHLPAYAEELRARLEWAHTVDLRAFESGVVQQVNVLEGQSVSKGDVLISLDPRDFDLAIQSARAKLKQAEAVLDKAARELEWETELYDQGLISSNELRDHSIANLDAEARVEEARAALATAELARERAVIKAPFDGVVTAVRSWQGQVVLKTLQQEPLIEMAEGGSMVARTRVSASSIGKYESRQPARVLIGDRWRDGYIYRIGTISEGVLEQGVAYAVDIMFSLENGETMRPGHFCTVKIL